MKKSSDNLSWKLNSLHYDDDYECSSSGWFVLSFSYLFMHFHVQSIWHFIILKREERRETQISINNWWCERENMSIVILKRIWNIYNSLNRTPFRDSDIVSNIQRHPPLTTICLLFFLLFESIGSHRWQGSRVEIDNVVSRSVDWLNIIRQWAMGAGWKSFRTTKENDDAASTLIDTVIAFNNNNIARSFTRVMIEMFLEFTVVCTKSSFNGRRVVECCCWKEEDEDEQEEEKVASLMWKCFIYCSLFSLDSTTSKTHPSYLFQKLLQFFFQPFAYVVANVFFTVWAFSSSPMPLPTKQKFSTLKTVQRVEKNYSQLKFNSLQFGATRIFIAGRRSSRTKATKEEWKWKWQHLNSVQ